MRLVVCGAVVLGVWVSAAEAQDSPADRFFDGLRGVAPAGTVITYDPPSGDAAESTIGNLRIAFAEEAGTLTVRELRLTGIGTPRPDGLVPVDGLALAGFDLRPSRQEGHLAIGRLDVAGADLAAVVDRLTNWAPPEPADLLTLNASALLVEDLDFAAPRRSLGIDRLAVTELRDGWLGGLDLAGLRVTDTPLQGEPTRTEIAALAVEGYRFGPLIEAMTAQRYEAMVEATASLDLAGFRIEGLRREVPDLAGRESTTLDRLVIEDMVDGRVARATIDGLSFEMRAGSQGLPNPLGFRFAIEAAELSGLRIGPLLGVPGAGSQVEAANLLSQVAPDRFSLSALSLAGFPFAPDLLIDTLLLDGVERTDGRMTGHSLSISFAVAGLDAPPIVAFLDAAGLEELPLSLAYRQHLDPAAGTLRVDDLAVGLAGSPVLTGSLALGSVPAERYVFGIFPTWSRLEGETLQSLDVVLDGQAVAGPLLAAVESGAGLPLGSGSAMILGALSAQLGPLPDGHPARALADGLAAFLQGGRLALTAAPSPPLPLTALAGDDLTPAGLVERLGLETRVE